MNTITTKATIIQKLAVKADQDDAPRGDHDLNPGTAPKPPLKPAAVLVGLVDHNDSLNVLLTQRTPHLQHHGGQISFPGGHLEEDDGKVGSWEAAVNGAIRETEEEVGIAPSHIDIVGRLDSYITRTGFHVTPVVGLITPPFDLNPDPHEVAEVFEVPLSFLMDPANHQKCTHEFHGYPRHFHAMPYQDYYIWGATAGMLMNMFSILKD